MSLEQGQAAARQTGLAMLATLRNSLGSLDRITRVVKLLGLVRSTDQFDQQPQVINGCSQLFADIWGTDLGIGTRSALERIPCPQALPLRSKGFLKSSERRISISRRALAPVARRAVATTANSSRDIPSANNHTGRALALRQPGLAQVPQLDWPDQRKR